MVEERSKLEAKSVSGKTCTVSYGLNELLRLSITQFRERYTTVD